MHSEDPPDPAKAIRTSIARSMSDVDIRSWRDRGVTREAVEALDQLEQMEQRKKAFTVALRLEVAAFVVLAALSLLCAAAMVWIAVSRGWDGSGEIAVLGTALGLLLRALWAVRKRSRQRLESIAGTPECEDADET